MPNYFVRIEMHGADTAEYNELHEKMIKNNFSRFADSNQKYPDATYVARNTGTGGAEKVNAILQRIIKKITPKSASIMVVEFVNDSDISSSHLEAREDAEQPTAKK